MNWPKDKQDHFFYTLGLGAVIAANWGAIAGIAAGTIAAVAKEVYDWRDNRKKARYGLAPVHTVDPWDAAASFLGGAFGALLSSHGVIR